MKFDTLISGPILLLSIFILAGCTTHQSYENIAQSAQLTNISDGVNEQEAIILAQNYLIEHGLEVRHSLYYISEVLRRNGIWTIRFGGNMSAGGSDSFENEISPPITLQVDMKSGEVTPFLNSF